MRDGALAASPFHARQHAYREVRSVESSLHAAVTLIQGQLGQTGYPGFLDIEGASYHLSVGVRSWTCLEAYFATMASTSSLMQMTS